MAEKRPRTERSASEMDTDAGGEASTATEYQSKVKKEHMTNIYLTYSDKEVIVDFVQDHEELYDKTNEHLRTRPGRIACGKDLQVWCPSLHRSTIRFSINLPR